jgi:uncharacterized protein YjbI with pentapeptide repeats
MLAVQQLLMPAKRRPTVRRWGIIKLLQIGATLSVLFAVISYTFTDDDRRKERQYEAWQVITAAQGKGGSGGRIAALQDLLRDSVSLAGVDLRHAWLNGIQLPHARLYNAALDSARLASANFQSASMVDASLRGAVLWDANLRRAVLLNADLRGADLTGADLRDARLWNADLRGARLTGANLQMANLEEAHLQGAQLDDADLTGALAASGDFRTARLYRTIVARADFTGANFQQAILIELQGRGQIVSLRGANVLDANAWRGFMVWAVDTLGATMDTAQSRRIAYLRRPASGLLEYMHLKRFSKFQYQNRSELPREDTSVFSRRTVMTTSPIR